MGGAAGRVGMPTTAQGSPDAQGGPTTGQMPAGLQDMMARIQANPMAANLPQQSMIQRYAFGQPNPSMPSSGVGLQGGYAGPRPVQNFAPQIVPQMARPAAPMSAPGQPSEIEQLRAEIAALRGNQNQYSGGGN